MSNFNVFEVEVDFLTELEADDFNLNDSFLKARQLEADQLATISVFA
jgi:hypothetical protein